MLCGTTPNCGCSMSTVAATTGTVGGQLPTITVTGNGNTVPWAMSLNTAWASAVVTAALALAPTPWTNVTFTAPYTNYGGGYQLCQYRKIGDMVYLRGLVARSPFVSGAEVFLLPVGFRPPKDVYVPADHNALVHGGVVVEATGSVRTYYVVGDEAYWSLSSIAFSVTT